MKHTAFIDENGMKHYRKRAVQRDLPADHVYHEITNRLFSRLALMRMLPTEVVNMGWHTQSTQNQLQQQYPSANVMSVHSVAALQDIKNDSVDLVFSHFSMLCEPDPGLLLQHYHRILRDEGLLLFVDVGPDTLMELRMSFAFADALPHIHHFIDMHHIGDLLRALHFSDPVMDREMILLAYDTIDLLFQDLKTAGIMNAHINRRRSLFPKSLWQKMLMQYAQLKTDEYYPASLEVIYGHGWKVPVQQNEDDEIIISVDKIKRQSR